MTEPKQNTSFIVPAFSVVIMLGIGLSVLLTLRPETNRFEGEFVTSFDVESPDYRPPPVPVPSPSKETVAEIDLSDRFVPVPAPQPEPVRANIEVKPLADAHVDPTMLTKAVELVDSGHIEAAVAELEAILAKDPDNEQALIELGMIHLLDYRRPSDALPYLKAALKVNPNNRMVASEIVGVYEEQGKPDDGVGFLKQLYDDNPESEGLALGIGQMLLSQGRDQDALPYLESAAKRSQDGSYQYSELARIYHKSGDYSKAARAYADARMREEENLSHVEDPGIASIIRDRIETFKKQEAQARMDAGDYAGAEEVLRQPVGHRG